MNPQIKLLYKFSLVIAVLLNLSLFSQFALADENSVQSFGWGGGGAFTSTALLNNDMYLSSDVAGVWKQVQGNWQPFVNGLGNYNVTSLATFNNKLFAITSDELFVTDGNTEWTSTNIKLNTNRNTNDQPYSISPDKESLCIANRNQKIDCIDSNNQLVSYPTPVTVINGVYFEPTDSNVLYFFSGAELFTLNLNTEYIELAEIFNEKIVSMATYENKTLVATSKNVFDINHLEQPIYQAGSSTLINFFVTKYSGDDMAFINTGNMWYAKVKKLDFIEGEFVKNQSVTESYDSSLPHRPYQKNLTKLLGVNTLGNKTFVTDFWGVYQLQIESVEGDLNLVEVSAGAVNTIATDLVVTSDNLYVSAMDNGIVKITQADSYALPLYKALAFDRLQGHAWSLLQDGNTVHGVISPWSDSNDYLFSYSESDESSNIEQLTDYTVRQSEGAFWGQGYARQLVDYNGITSFRDGVNGGLITDDTNLIDYDGPITLGEQNRVYRSIVVHNELLYIANCEGASVMVALNQFGETILSKPLPNGFCPFTAYSAEDSLYLLGSNSGKSVIYRFENDEFSLMVSQPVGNAFYQMAVNPQNEQQLVAGTISWSNSSDSGLFVSNDGGQNFFDKSCLLTHKNGVAAIKFDNNRAYILQKVGGGIAVPASILFSENECSANSEYDEYPIIESVINFSLLTMQGYGGAQDTDKGTVSIEDDGITLKLVGNRWRSANFEYELTPNTVIEFDFKSSVLGEIHGLGLDNNSSLTPTKTFNIFGSQAYGVQSFGYSGSGEYEHFSIPIGQFYTGKMNYLFFAMDQDIADPTAESYFRNVKVVER